MLEGLWIEQVNMPLNHDAYNYDRFMWKKLGQIVIDQYRSHLEWWW